MRKLNIVAHQDDSLLFMSPDIVVDAGNVWTDETVIMTDGWSGQPGLDNLDYVASRNTGLMTAIAEMVDIAEPTWATDYLVLNDHPVTRYTLTQQPTQSVVFLDLQEYTHSGGAGAGGCDEQGSSLTALYAECVDTVTTNGGLSYSKDELTQALFDLINEFGPDEVRIQDQDPGDGFAPFHSGAYHWPDHPDHTAAARFAGDAALRFRAELDATVEITQYRCYNIASYQPENVTGELLASKLAAFASYAPFDADGGVQAYQDPANFYFQWLRRQCYR